MHPKTLLFTLLFTAVPLLHSQVQFQPGYIIGINGETKHGLIENTGEVSNSQICHYKANEQIEAVEYLPGEITAYRFADSKFYESKTIVLDGSEQEVFAECLVKGTASLYYYRDANVELYYIDKEGSAMLVLTKEKNRYIRLLKASFSDCMEIQSAIDQVKLTHRSLTSVTCKYNAYMDNSELCITYEQGSRAKIKIGPVVGFSSDRLSLKGDALFEAFDFENSNDPAVGVLLELSSSRLGNHLSLQLGAELSKSIFHAYYEKTNSLYSTVDYYYDVNLQALSLEIYGGPKYSFTGGRVRPNLGGGLMFHKYIQADFWYIKETHIVDLVTTEEWRQDIVSNLFYGAYVQAGVEMDLSQRVVLFANVKGGYCLTNPKIIVDVLNSASNQIRIRSELIPVSLSLGILF